jgi:replication factor A1
MATAAAKRKPVFVKVDQLKPGTAGHTLVAKVLSSKTVPQKGRPGPAARPTKIAECLIGDETGCILSTARNEQGTIRSPSVPDSVLSSVCMHLYLTLGSVGNLARISARRR